MEKHEGGCSCGDVRYHITMNRCSHMHVTVNYASVTQHLHSWYIQL